MSEGAFGDKDAATAYSKMLKNIIEEKGYKSWQVFSEDGTSLFWKKMPKSRGIKPEVIKREINLVNTIQSVSLQTNGSATSSGSAILGASATSSGSATPGGGAIDWKKKYKDEFDKRFAIEEQFDDLQTQVLNNPTNDWFERTNVFVLGSFIKSI